MLLSIVKYLGLVLLVLLLGQLQLGQRTLGGWLLYQITANYQKSRTWVTNRTDHLVNSYLNSKTKGKSTPVKATRPKKQSPKMVETKVNPLQLSPEDKQSMEHLLN